MKQFLKRIVDFFYNPKNEKLILFGMPVLAVVIATLILAPEIIAVSNAVSRNVGNHSPEPEMYIFRAEDETGQAVSGSRERIASADAQSSALSPTAKPTATPTPTPESRSQVPIQTHLTAASTERDLYIFVRDSNGTPIRDKQFVFNVGFPTGETYSYKADDDGGCYLVNLNGGEYSVSINDYPGIITPEQITCVVKDRVEYIMIEDIDELVDVTDDVLILEEIKTNTGSAPVEAIPEILITPGEAIENKGVIYQSLPVLDANGNQTYYYTFDVGPSGCLLYSDGSESNVYPNVEKNNREEKLVCGLVYDADLGAYSAVELFKPNNLPLEEYSIRAEPITKIVANAVGWQNINGKIYYYDSKSEPVTGLKNIDGVLYYFNQNGERASSLGIDVSFYNGSINWAAVKNAGIDFAILRVGGRGWSSGLLYDDSCFSSYIQGARSVGMKIGIYFYSTAVNAREAVEEASLALDRLNGLRLDYPIFIDMEFSGEYPEGRADNLSPVQRVEIAQAFCETVKSYGYKPGIYAAINYYYYSLNYASVSQYMIWLANYRSDNKLPNFDYEYDIWQFSDRGYVNGISGPVDMNVIF